MKFGLRLTLPKCNPMASTQNVKFGAWLTLEPRRPHPRRLDMGWNKTWRMAHGEWRMANGGGWGVDFGGSPHCAIAVCIHNIELFLEFHTYISWWCTHFLYYHSAVNFSKDKYYLINHIHISLLQFIVVVLVLQLLNLVSVLAGSVGTRVWELT
jgi:hypothetical protein